MKRRVFLLSALGAGGALLIGWSVTPPRSRLGTVSKDSGDPGSVALNGWVRIARDGGVAVVVPRCEMGQGVFTALPMLVAEELDVPLSRVSVAAADDDAIYANLVALGAALAVHPDQSDSLAARSADWFVAKPGRELGLQFTGGSSSVRDAWLPMRQAGAAARSMLIEAAARRWGVPASSCTARDATVHDSTGRSLGYGELAASAARLSPPARIELKKPAEFRLIGHAIGRTDSADKVTGRTE
jgi:isoquinoline 1-oxidoreductase beta subunit